MKRLKRRRRKERIKRKRRRDLKVWLMKVVSQGRAHKIQK
jgi:hypothetical protein